MELVPRIRKDREFSRPSEEGKVPLMPLEDIDILVTALETLQPTPVHSNGPHTALAQFQLVSGPPLKAFLKSHRMELCTNAGKVVGELVGGIGVTDGNDVGELLGLTDGGDVGEMLGKTDGGEVGEHVVICADNVMLVDNRHGSRQVSPVLPGDNVYTFSL